MSVADRIRTDSITYGGSVLLVRVLLFCSLVLFARILSPEQFGALNVLTIAGLALCSLASLEFAQGLMRFCAAAAPEVRDRYFATGFWFVVFSGAVSSIVLILLAERVSSALFGNEKWRDEVIAYSVCSSLNVLFLLLQSQCRCELKRNAFVVATLTWTVSSFSLSLLLAHISDKALIGIIIGQALGAVAGAVAALAYLGVPRFGWVSLRALWQLVAYSAPLVVSILSILAATYANRIALSRWGSLNDVAAFTAAAQIANFASLTLLGIQFALGPLILAHHQSKSTPSQVADVFATFWIVTMTLCLLLGIFAEPIVKALFPAAYHHSAAWVFLLSIATILSQAYVFWPGFTVRKWTLGQMLVTVGSGLAGVCINVIGVWGWGVSGAVIGAVATSALFLLSWAIVSNWCYPIPIPLLKALCIPIVAFGVYLLVRMNGSSGDVSVASAFRVIGATAAFGLFAWYLMKHVPSALRNPTDA